MIAAFSGRYESAIKGFNVARVAFQFQDNRFLIKRIEEPAMSFQPTKIGIATKTCYFGVDLAPEPQGRADWIVEIIPRVSRANG